MSRIRASLALACLAVPLLVACGSGTSGSSNLREIDAAQARTLFTGSTPLAKTREEMGSEVGQLIGTVGRSPHATLHLTDVPFFSTRADVLAPLRVPVRCTTSGCTMTIRGTDVPFTIADLLFGREDIRPMMVHRRIPIAHGAGSDTLEGIGGLDVYSYGGWMRYNVFGVHESAVTTGDARGLGFYYGMSFGTASNAPPTPAGGSAHWSGVMVGMDNAGRDRGNIIQGDAGITVDFDALDADVAFTNVHDLTAGTARGGKVWNDVRITDEGTFSGGASERERVEGLFYGPGHEEAGGVFEYDDITGAFGASRDD